MKYLSVLAVVLCLCSVCFAATSVSVQVGSAQTVGACEPIQACAPAQPAVCAPVMGACEPVGGVAMAKAKRERVKVVTGERPARVRGAVKAALSVPANAVKAAAKPAGEASVRVRVN